MDRQTSALQRNRATGAALGRRCSRTKDDGIEDGTQGRGVEGGKRAASTRTGGSRGVGRRAEGTDAWKRAGRVGEEGTGWAGRGARDAAGRGT